jgi:hypothetical protein
MAAITLAQAETRLALYLAAEEKILKGQKVEMDGKSLTRADLGLVQQGVATYNGMVSNLTRSDSIRVMRVVPL